MPMDSETRALMHELASPIVDQPRREAFIRAVAERVEASPVAVGPGAVMAVGRELQRRFFDPPSFHGGQVGRRI
jgi:hypothetical protein